MIWSRTDQDAIAVTVSDQQTLLDDVAQRFRNGQGFSVATLNLDHVVKLGRNPAFRRAYAQQTHVTADGNPIVWLGRLSGQKELQRVPGSELIEPVIALAEKERVSIALLGATDASLAAAADVLKRRHPGLDIAMTLAPSMNFDPEGLEGEQAIEAIHASGARLVFLALGAPKQEIFAARAQDRLSGVGFLSIGAGLDFISGAQSRAPIWVRKIAAEWLWRLLGNPRRFAARYLACLLVLPKLMLRASVTRLNGRRLTS